VKADQAGARFGGAERGGLRSWSGPPRAEPAARQGYQV